jgi:hypothetical protein
LEVKKPNLFAQDNGILNIPKGKAAVAQNQTQDRAHLDIHQ